jgi:uncharacterized protein (TIGR00369 family)
MALLMDKTALETVLARDFGDLARLFAFDAVSEEALTLRLTPEAGHIRSGGTVSGPTMFLLADVAFFFAILSQAGDVAMAATTNAHIDFLRKPAADQPLLGEARVLKLGRTLSTGSVTIRNPGSDRVLAQAQMTFAMPPKEHAM